MKIISKEILSDIPGSRVVRMRIYSPDIAGKALPGQFAVLMAAEEGERIPLTIAEADKQNGSIILIFQEAGFTTKLLGRMESGDSLFALAGPLGHPTDIMRYGKVIVVGGGVGIAEAYPVARALRGAGNDMTVISGAKNKESLILHSEMKDAAHAFYATTDDGSSGRKAFTTDILEELLKKEKYDFIYAVGPIPMMKKASEIAASFKVKTIVSLNALMVDATGMCGCCRVRVGGETKFSCVDGPEFDASLVDWEELAKRNCLYLEQEKHICRLKLH